MKRSRLLSAPMACAAAAGPLLLCGASPANAARPAPRASQPLKHRYFLGTELAAYYMRKALGRDSRLGFQAGYARRVKCNHRVKADRLRCTMSWIEGDIGFVGRGMIWVTYQHHVESWNYSYRVVRVNEYCAIVEERDNCTKVITVR